MTILVNARNGLLNPSAFTVSSPSFQLLSNSHATVSVSCASSPVASTSSPLVYCNSHRLPSQHFPGVPTNKSCLSRRKGGWKVGLQSCVQRCSVEDNSQVSMSSKPSNEEPSFSMEETRVSTDYMSKLTGAPRSSNSAEKEDDTAASSIEKIEQRTKASIDKLKHILYKVKTRPADGSLMNLADEWTSSTPARSELRLQRLIDMGLFDEGGQAVDKPSSQKEGTIEEELPFHSSFPEAYVQDDGLTSTRTTVKFDKHSMSATVTITATVRDSGDSDPASQEPGEKSIMMAARAIARCAAEIEEKASVSSLASKLKALPSKDSVPGKSIHHHERQVYELTHGKIVETTQVRKGYYSGTPFRPVYKVKLEQADGSITEALLKPALPGDVHSQWGSASADWVAYQVGRLLGTDMVPPAAIRRDVKVGDKVFPLATLLHVVPNVKPLTRLTPQEWGGELPAVFVSNAHILDALMGSCPRARSMFMEGPSWSAAGTKQAMLLDHPMAPGQGKLHPMWTQRGQVSGVKCVSEGTLVRLKSLNRTVLTATLGLWVGPSEVDRIVERLQEVLSYFEAVAQHGSRDLAVV